MTFVVFDLDDTLYLERDFAFSAYSIADQWVLARIGLSGLERACRSAFEKGDRTRIFDRALALLGCPPDPTLVTELTEIYRHHTPRISLQPDAQRALRRYAGRAALISDGLAATQSAKVEALGLRDYLAPIVLTGALGPNAGKPAPDAYLQVERATGLGKNDLVYVADNPVKDFITPRRLGWQTVMIARPGRVHTAPPPTPLHAAEHRITTLDDLETVLQPAKSTV
ncbi:hypothetical protein PARPLA_03320 [Rhodobacteraceae bacterium THAF1]|uniref:HAD family hydrolase n=1 Tax=Palleronia sp. THAF1 TaxID=2587842 RepID=UPI000F3AAA80|nr:HAD family hydrolase [Palleronia sp. THAF1]QFU10332.1 hypothetical protein FIU81_16745 [Palleronia sp. THAF1]VDC31450.1 hypothetical protein PARPLA_03320 [Rhodobacteraceae bacterium THAF1]